MLVVFYLIFFKYVTVMYITTPLLNNIKSNVVNFMKTAAKLPIS